MKNATKQAIDAMTLEELTTEVRLGRLSRFQREKMAYLMSVREKRLRDELTNVIDNGSQRHRNHRDWFKEAAIPFAVTVLGGLALWFLTTHFGSFG